MTDDPNVANIEVGQTLYWVHHLGMDSFINKYEVLGKPRQWFGADGKEMVTNALWIDALHVHKDGYKDKDTISLCDMGIDFNRRHNKHRTFFSKEKAEMYLRWAKSGGVGLSWEQAFEDMQRLSRRNKAIGEMFERTTQAVPVVLFCQPRRKFTLF